MIRILFDILFDIVIFYIIYKAMDKGVGYLKNVLIYTVGMEIELFLTILFSGYISILVFFLVFGAYFVQGLLVIFILDKLNNRYLLETVPFVIIAVAINLIIKYATVYIFGGLVFIGLV